MNDVARSGSGRVFVDANILMYSEDSADPIKQQSAMAWLDVLWQRGMGCVSTQVLNEFYGMATRQLTPPMPAGDARAEVRRYALWQPWLIDHATVESAWALESRFGLHYDDCLVVAAAQHLGCRYLLSEAMAHEQHYGGVQVINPFKTSIDLLAAL
jgi:predicted nucleic acid-binding protein